LHLFCNLEKEQVRELGFCLSLNPKHILPTNFARKFLLFEWIKAYKQNCGCETIVKEIASSDGQLYEK
jgi:hypothetical protein